MPAARPIREIALVYGAVAAATFGITRLRSGALADYVHLMVGTLFLVVAMRLAQREPDGMRRYGIDLAGLMTPPEDGADRGPLGIRDLLRATRAALPSAARELGVALGLCGLIFPPFAVGFRFWHGSAQPFTLQLPDEPLSFALAQVLVVALPEEALFRGYFQTRLGDAFPRKVRVLGVEVCPVALVTQAALFALVHFVVDFSPERLAVFFPGLLFGWLRSWRSGVGAAIAMHALSNVFSDLLVRGWL